jgi:hypothetical protein
MFFMKRIVSAVFVITAALLAVFFINRKYFCQQPDTVVRPRVVKPVVQAESDQEAVAGDVIRDDTASTTFIPLRSDETLLNSLTVDFNGDGSDDQIIVVKRIGSPYLIIIVGLYNRDAAAYERSAEIPTKVIHEQTFSYTVLDMTGDHRMTLVYQGFTESGGSVLALYLASLNHDNFELKSIGNFESDGAVYIDQFTRSDSYELSRSRGKSFPVWVYSSDTSEGANDLDQIQTEYDWDSAAQEYVQKNQYKITGKRLAAKELARIQDGSVETFAGFLNGLWYKTSNQGDGIRYLYFDWNTKEIIFLFNDTEEVYSWLDSNLRRNGIYLYTSNTSITNLQRRFDISLVSTDEVRIRLQDDVRMLIKESNLWDGTYKKMSTKTAFTTPVKISELQILLDDLKKGPSWDSADGVSVVFNQGTYTVTGDSHTEEGIFVGYRLQDKTLIQFHSDSAGAYFSGSYLVTKPESKGEGRDSLVFYPVTVNPDGYTLSDNRQIVLTRHETEAIEDSATGN